MTAFNVCKLKSIHRCRDLFDFELCPQAGGGFGGWMDGLGDSIRCKCLQDSKQCWRWVPIQWHVIAAPTYPAS